MLNFFKSLFGNKKTLEFTVSSSVEFTPPSEEEIKVSNLRKNATQKKKQNDFDRAVSLLGEAIDLSKKHKISITAKDYIRYANYLQLAKRNDEAWRVFNKIICGYLDIFDQIEIYNAMRLFLQREGRNKLAVQYGVLVRLLEIKKWKEFKKIIDVCGEAVIQENEKRWKEISTYESVDYIVEGLLKKSKLLSAKGEIIDATIKFIEKTPKVDVAEVFHSIPNILNKYDNKGR